MLELQNILFQYVREDARLFNHIHSNSILGFTFIDLRHENVSWTNPLLLNRLGYAFNQQEDSDLPVTIFTPNAIADLVKTITSQTNSTKDEIEAKINCIRFDQTIIEASTLVHLFADEKGAPAYLLILVESLQIQHFLIDQLTEDNQQFLEIIDGLKMGTWKWNVQSGNILVNKYWTAMLGYEEKELLPINIDTWNRVVHPEDIAIASAAFNAHFDGKTETYFCELRMRHKLGHWIWIEDRGKLIARTADGKPYIMVGSQIDITQKKINEIQLEHVREILATTNRLARVGGWEIDLSNNTLSWADVTAEIHEVEPGFAPSVEEAIAFYPEGENRAIISKAVDDAIHKQKPFNEILQILTAKHNLIWVHAIGAPIVENGKTVKVSGVFQDIDAQKRAEDLVTVQHRQLENITKALDDSAIVSITDLRGKIVKANKKFCEISKYNLDELLGSDHRIVNSGYHPKSYWKEMWDCISIGKTWNGEVKNKAKDGSFYWVYSIIHPVYDVDGKIIQYISIRFPITDKKKTEETLIASEASATFLARQYKSVLDNQTVFIIKIDISKKYTYFNKHFREKFLVNDNIFGAVSLEDIFIEDQNKCTATVQKCFNEPEVPHQVVLKKMLVNGSIGYSKWEFKGMLDPQTKIVDEILCVGFDVTQQIENLQRSEQLLRVTNNQNNQLKNFAYIISHNIRSHSANLTSLVSFMETAKDEAEIRLFVSMLKSSTNQLEETIQNLNEVVTVNESITLIKERKRLRLEIENTIHCLNGLILEKQMIILNNVPENISVSVVPSYLDSILLNLLSNAIKYRKPIGETVIEISAYQEAEMVVLCIKDNGIGIDLKKYGHKIFGMYKTFHGNQDARGFGLFITKSQIDSMGGKITIESSPNVGSTFKVYFSESN
jgi:PAS domain S-box-containing protein